MKILTSIILENLSGLILILALTSLFNLSGRLSFDRAASKYPTTYILQLAAWVKSAVYYRMKSRDRLLPAVTSHWDPESDHKRVWEIRKLSSDRNERSSLHTSSGKGFWAGVSECPSVHMLNKRRNVVNLISLLFHQRQAVWWRISCSSLLRSKTEDTSVRVAYFLQMSYKLKRIRNDSLHNNHGQTFQTLLYTEWQDYSYAIFKWLRNMSACLLYHWTSLHNLFDYFLLIVSCRNSCWLSEEICIRSRL